MEKRKRLFLVGFLAMVLFLAWPCLNGSSSFLLAGDDDENPDVSTSSTSTSESGDASTTTTTCEKSPEEGDSGGLLSFKSSIVPCGRNCDDTDTAWNEAETCTLCHLILMAKNIYDLLFAMVIFASILMITIGGTIYLVSAGSRSLAGTGKELITKTLAGFALFLLGELIVITVLNFVGANLGVVNSNGNFFTFTCDTTSLIGSSTSSGGGASPTTSPTTSPTSTTPPSGGTITAKKIPTSCDAYKESFKSASGGNEEFACLLVGIAAKEGGGSCDADATSGKECCGLMQIKSGTNGKDCAYLNSHPEESISIAKGILDSYKSAIGKYSSTFDIGNNDSQTGETVKYGGYSFDTGNDDLIASYNAGTGNGTNSDGTKQPFYVSKDCSTTPATPAWQCNINPGGFSETQNYVPGVQSYQKGCLEQKYFN